MTFFEKVTGVDLTREYKEYDERIKKLPTEYQEAWDVINDKLMPYSDFSGRNLLPLVKSVLEMLEEMNSQSKTIDQIFGSSIDNFCKELTEGMISYDIRDKWRNKLNKKIEQRFQK